MSFLRVIIITISIYNLTSVVSVMKDIGIEDRATHIYTYAKS